MTSPYTGHAERSFESQPPEAETSVRPDGLALHSLPIAAQFYVGVVIVGGAALAVALFPSAYPRPWLFGALLASACLTSVWKVNLPIGLTSGSTLSVAHAAELMALLLLGAKHTMLIAMAAAWTQCTFNTKRRYPLYRTVFSVGVQAITIAVTAAAYDALGGPAAPTDFLAIPKPLLGAMAAYFFVNTGFVAGAIALSSGQPFRRVWRDDFLWSGVNFMVASTAGAVAAVVIARGDQWIAVLMLAPVYLTYRTYGLFVKRLEDQARYVTETRRLHQEAVDALMAARQAERALADEKERLTVTLRSVGDGVITADLNGTILSINKVAEALTGWTHEEAIGRPVAEVFQNFDPETRQRCDTSIAKLISESHAFDVGRRSSILAARNLAEHPIEESTAPIRDAEGRAIGIVLAFRDITDALRIQEERAKANKLASLGLLAGGMAHDFNDILMAVMGNVSMARATMSGASSPTDWLAEAEQACVRARHLTWQLLTFAKGGVPAKKTIEVGSILQESVGLVLRGSSVGCTLQIPPDLWRIEADAAQLAQVFTDVTQNARESMVRTGAITIRADNVRETEPRWENALRVEPGCYVRVSITDTGIGIPKEHLSRIFDPYFSTKGASGLGLATAYSIVKNHGGFVSVDSRLGGGTTIQLSFPALSNVARIEHPQPMRRTERRGRRVLVMDDEARVRTLTMHMLGRLGYSAEVAESGSAAVERFKQALHAGSPFDVVLLDLLVPGDIDATEAITRLGALDPGVKAILMSGLGHDPATTEFQAYGFRAVITKPFTLRELNATLHTVLASTSSRIH